MHKLACASLLLAPFVFPVAALADTASDVQALKREIEVLRSDYEARIKALELRIEQATGASPAPVAAAPEMTAPAPTPAPTAPAAGGGTAFNPAMSLILSGGYARTSRDPVDYRIKGFALPPGSEIGPGTRGFSLAETELGLAASIDPWLRGAANISLLPGGGVAVEEAFVQTTSLGNGLTLKAGRFLSSVGYLNAQHAHAWDFVDAPLAYQAMLGTQYGDDGVQLRWLAPTDRFVEVGLEAGRGREFPGSGTGRNGAGTTVLTLHTGGDIGESQSWRAGVSVLNAKATDQALSAIDASGAQVTNLFTGRRRVWIVDGVWKWAPEGNATRTNFKLQGEYLRSTGTGSMTYDVAGANSTDSYRAAQSGWYVQAVYQFMPRWRAGLRTERLNPGSPDYGISTAALAGDGFRPSKTSAMLDFNPSEFSRVRLQLARDNGRDGRPDNQFFIQYQMSLGAHGAHGF